MRKTLLILTILLAFTSQAYNLQSVDKALDEMRLGHVEESISILKKLAAVNDMSAQYYLGSCYEFGIGMDENPQMAFNMYRRAAERGFPPAMYELAKCYTKGLGVSVNQNRADEWMARYDKKKDNSVLPDLVEIYANRESAPEQTVKSQDLAQASSKSTKTPASDKNNRPAASTSKAPVVNSTREIKRQPDIALSDVDIDIPKSRESNTNLFALIIANENYQDVAAVPYALNDGDAIAKYCQKTLGIPETNIHLVKDATLNNIKREINLMSKIGEAYKGDASFLIYYAGHGIPDEKSRDAFLMPVDGFPADISTCFSLNEFYAALSAIPSKKTIVMLDACFSGASREGGMLMSARGVAMRPKAVTPVQNLLVISSATGDETSYPYEEKKHGLFTYFLLKKLKESNGEVNIGSLMDYVHSNVTKTSIVVNGKSQTPSVTPSSELGEDWKNWKLK